MRYYESNDDRLGAHMPFNFQLIYVSTEATAYHIKRKYRYMVGLNASRAYTYS